MKHKLITKLWRIIDHRPANQGEWFLWNDTGKLDGWKVVYAKQNFTHLSVYIVERRLNVKD